MSFLDPPITTTNVYTAVPVVEIVVQIGTPKEREKLCNHYQAMVVPSGEIIDELRKFLIDENVAEWRHLSSSGGHYHGYFLPEEAEKVFAWLRKKQVFRSPVKL